MKKFIEKNKQMFVLLTLSMAILIIVLDSTLMNVSIFDLVREFDTSVSTIQSLITIYALVMASFMIAGGKIGDIIGRKKTFLIGVGFYGVGTLMAALSPNITVLLIGWSIIEGIGAAFMLPATLAILMANFQGKDRAMAFAIWGGIAAAGSALGPIFGGFMTTYFSWRLAFGSELIFVILIFLFSGIIKETKDNVEKKSLDLIGVLLSASGFAFLVYGILKASTFGWFKSKIAYEIFGQTFEPFGLSITIISIFVGVIILTIFVYWQQKLQREGKNPLVSLNLFSNSNFRNGNISNTVLIFAQSGIIFTIPVLLQTVRGYNALETGVALLPLSLALMFASVAMAKLGSKYSPKHIIQIGIIINIISIFVLWFSVREGFTRFDLTPGLFLFGLGMGFVFSQITNVMLSTISVQEAGEASGLNGAIRQLGTSLGTAVIGTILLSSLNSKLIDNIQSSQSLTQESKSQFESTIKSGGDVTRNVSNDDNQFSQELKEIIDQSTIDANKEVLVYTAGFTFLSLIATMGLPKWIEHKKQKE